MLYQQNLLVNYCTVSRHHCFGKSG